VRCLSISLCLALAACGLPGSPQDGSRDRREQLTQARHAHMRARMAAGTFGHEQLFPGTVPVDPRYFRRLPPPRSILPPPSSLVAPPQLPALRTASLASERAACVYKPVMSDADMEACR
jgi:hypothetical protein